MGYMLRVTVFEDSWEKSLDDIIAVCKKSDIREVFFMEEFHDILLGVYPFEKHKKMAEIFCRISEILRREGITFNINIGSIVGHTDGAIEDGMILPFQKIVGDDLCEDISCYCILDKNWQDFAASVCSLYAESKPDMIFIDDDFRSVNHRKIMGCFCPIHVERTSEECGINLFAQSLYEHVCGRSKADMNVKEAWMKVNFEGQLQAAKKMRIEVEKICPHTRLGLMNSGEEQHSVQGRDMDKLLREFSGKGHRPLSRPAGGAYIDVMHDEMLRIHQRMALSINVLGKDVQIVSEVDNWPYTGFTKSMHVTKSQLEIHSLAGAHDFLVNLNNYLTIPVLLEPDHLNLLISESKYLSVIQEARRNKKAKGFGLPWKTNTAAKMSSRRGNINDIIPDRTVDCLMSQFGIPTQFEVSKGNVILGDAINCYGDNEIRSLLKSGLMIDGQALENLCSRGFQALLGCNINETVSKPFIERLDDNDFSGKFAKTLIPSYWYNLKEEAKYAYKLNPESGARTISTIFDYEMNEIGPAVILYENEIGGRVAIFAIPVNAKNWIYRGKTYQVAKIADWLMYGQLPLWIEGCPNVGPFYYEDESTGEGLLGIVSGNIDPVEMKIHTDLGMVDLFTGEKDFDQKIDPLSVRFFRTWHK